MDGMSFVEAQMTNGKPVEEAEMPSGPIGEKQCLEWARILNKYKAGKALLESRMRENQQYWRGKHWRQIRAKMVDQPEPTSAWLTNVILSKHAARMDAYPEATVLAREIADEPEASSLTSILPCIMDICEFKKTFSQVGWDKEISCAGAYCITWDANKHNGLGDIDIAPVDLMNLFWEPGITDIQQSKYLFTVALVDEDNLKAQYPQVANLFKAGGSKVIEPTKYVYEDNIDTTDKECVVDVYYKRNVNGKTILHYAKFVRDILLYATENETKPVVDAMGRPVGLPLAERGLYDHGKYPFVIEPVFPVKGSIAGFGYVDICRDPQNMIDIMGGAIVKNCIENATPRYFVRTDAGINVEEFSDMTKRIISANGNLGDDSVKPVQQTALQGNILNFYQYKIDEMKQTSGNRDASNGGTESGVTAASALAIMQESGNALSRDENGVAYDAFKDICKFVIELIRQFYDLPRFFRIAGAKGASEYITYTNAHLQEQQSLGPNGQVFYRLPEFDLEVTCSASSEYSAQSQNNLALQFYQAGFFNPMNAVMALQCLDMMQFRGKDKMILGIQQNAMMYQQMMMQQAVSAEPQESGSNAETRAESTADKKQAQAENLVRGGAQPR